MSNTTPVFRPYFYTPNLIFLLIIGGVIGLGFWVGGVRYWNAILIVYSVLVILFWFLVSIISFARKQHLKNEAVYYLVVGLVDLAPFVISIFYDHESQGIWEYVHLIFYVPKGVIVFFCLLPIDGPWEPHTPKHKDPIV